MKAKEYAAKIINAPDVDQAMKALAECGKDFVNEFVAMKNARNIKLDRGLVPLIKEFDNKFRTFVMLVSARYPGMVKPDGFCRCSIIHLLIYSITTRK